VTGMVEQIAADLAYFLRAAQLAPAIEDDFALANVRCLEAAWQINDMDHTTFGWVVALRDGRRLYLEYTMDDAEAGRPEDLHVTALQDSQAYPELERWEPVHWYVPDHINDYLGLPRLTP
jgi:hypothetical protein